MMTTLKNLMQMKSLNFRKCFLVVMKGYDAKSMSRILRRRLLKEHVQNTGAPIGLQDLQRRILTYLQGNSLKSNKLPETCISCIDF